MDGGSLQNGTSGQLLMWEAIDYFISAGKVVCRLFKDDLRELVSKSDNRFKSMHLREPFTVDLGQNKLSAGNYKREEEGYADWLIWILMQLSGAQILSIFGITDETTLKSCTSLTPVIKKEVSVRPCPETPYVRTDILIIYTDILLIHVAVKVIDARIAHVQEQGVYRKSLEGRGFEHIPKCHHILLVINSFHEEYDGYKVLRWADLCLNLRQIILTEGSLDNLLVKSAIAIFVGIVEQTLLGLSVSGFSGSSKLIDYMELILRR
ncbi:MAG: hypothetical protein NT178_18055 [Proteobacteria bacterium]|nr:hypothetical protein [Pseudomonadota bacterium]